MTIYDHIKSFFDVAFSTDPYDFFIKGVIMVSAIIVLIGILKPLLFNRIPWKPLRKACLAFTNVALCFAGVAAWYWIENIVFDFYWQTSIAISCFSIIVYWLYENTCLRDLIGKVGKLTLGKVGNVICLAIEGKDEDTIKKEIELSRESLKKSTKEEITLVTHKVKTDNELKNL